MKENNGKEKAKGSALSTVDETSVSLAAVVHTYADAMEAGKELRTVQKKKRDPDSETARRAVGRAISEHSVEKLKSLVEVEGLAIDVVQTSRMGISPSLEACLRFNFIEGFTYLLSRGAPRAWTKTPSGMQMFPGVNESGKEIPLTDWANIPDIGYGMRKGERNLLGEAIRKDAVDFVRVLWEGESVKSRQEESLYCCGAAVYEFLVEKNCAHYAYENGNNVGDICISYASKLSKEWMRAQKAGEVVSKEWESAAKHYKFLFSKIDESCKIRAWLQILREDSVELVGDFQKRGLFPEYRSKEAQVMISPRNLYGMGYSPMNLARCRDMDKSKTGEGLKEKVYSVEELIVLFSSTSKEKLLLRSVLSTPEGRAKIEESVESCWILAEQANLKLLKFMKKEGVDLSKLVNDKGYTPLHHSVAIETNIANVIEIAKLHPQWITAKDIKNKSPADMLTDPQRHEELKSRLQEVVIKKAVGGLNKGKRTNALRM